MGAQQIKQIVQETQKFVNKQDRFSSKNAILFLKNDQTNLRKKIIKKKSHVCYKILLSVGMRWITKNYFRC